MEEPLLFLSQQDVSSSRKEIAELAAKATPRGRISTNGSGSSSRIFQLLLEGREEAVAAHLLSLSLWSQEPPPSAPCPLAGSRGTGANLCSLGVGKRPLTVVGVPLWSLSALLQRIFVHSVFEAYYEVKTKGVLESPGTQISKVSVTL